MPIHLIPAPVCQLLYCTIVFFKVLYCKIKKLLFIFVLVCFIHIVVQKIIHTHTHTHTHTHIYKPPITVQDSIVRYVIWVSRLTLLNLRTRLLEQISFICSRLNLYIYILRVTGWQHNKGHKEYLKQTFILYIKQLRSRNKKVYQLLRKVKHLLFYFFLRIKVKHLLIALIGDDWCEMWFLTHCIITWGCGPSLACLLLYILLSQSTTTTTCLSVRVPLASSFSFLLVGCHVII